MVWSLTGCVLYFSLIKTNTWPNVWREVPEGKIGFWHESQSVRKGRYGSKPPNGVWTPVANQASSKAGEMMMKSLRMRVMKNDGFFSHDGCYLYKAMMDASDNQTWLAGKSPSRRSFFGKNIPLNGGFSVARFDCQRVYNGVHISVAKLMVWRVPGFTCCPKIRPVV